MDLATYQRHDRYRGYRALKKALTMPPDDVISIVKDSRLHTDAAARYHRDQVVVHPTQGDTAPVSHT